MSYANQRFVIVERQMPRDRNHIYAMMNIKALQKAMNDLKNSALKLWLYLNKNQQGFQFELSRQAALGFGIKKDSYYSAIDELLEKKYLKIAKENSNVLLFYEMPYDDERWEEEEDSSDSEKTSCFSDFHKEILKNPSMFSKILNEFSGNSIDFSENPERNNIIKNTPNIKKTTKDSRALIDLSIIENMPDEDDDIL